MTGPMQAPERTPMGPRPPRPPLGRPTAATAGPTRRKAQPPVIAAGGMLVVLGFLALTSWVGLLWAGIATGVAAVAGTGAVKAAKRRRSSPRRTGGTGGGLFPGLGRRRGGQTRKAGAPRNGMPRTGTPTRRPATGRRTALGSKATSGSPAKPRAKGLRGLLGKSGSSPRQGTSARPAGRSRNPFARKAPTGATATGSRPAGQRRSRNPFKRTSSTGTSARPAPGTSRSRNPFKRSASSTKGPGAPARSSGWRNHLKRTGTKPGPGPRSTTGKPTPRTGINPFRRRATTPRPGTTPTSGTRNPLRRKGTGPRTATSSTPPTGSARRGPAGWFKRRKGAAPTKTITPTRIPIKRGTPAPPPPTRAQVKQGIRAQAAVRREAAKAAPRGKVSSWLGSLGQPKPKRPRTTTVSTAGPAKFTGPARGKATVPTRAPQALLPDRKSARWSVGTGQDEEPGRRRSTPPPAPAPKRDAPAAPAPTPQPQQPKREAPSPPAKHSAKTCPVHGANCTVDHEAIRYGHKHDQPGRVPTTGGRKMTHAVQQGRDYDDMGLVAFVNAQGGLHEGAAALADQGRKMLAAADNQPLNPDVRANLEGFVAMLTTAASASEGMVAAARRAHEMDFARAEEPRGTRTQEKNADVAKTEADGF